MICPVKKCVWGEINSITELNKYIAKSGQPFGVDWSGPACNVNPTWPCDKTYYQYLNLNPPTNTHAGIDIPVTTGTEIYAVADGKVVEVSDVTTKGIGLVVYHSQLKLKSLYWHLQSHSVNLSDEVKEGQLIAISDNTGYSLGPHLHFEVKTTDEYGLSIKSVDPIPYISFKEMLTKKQVIELQALEGYHDQGGVEFWGDGTHTLDEYLAARIPDKISELNNSINGS